MKNTIDKLDDMQAFVDSLHYKFYYGEATVNYYSIEIPLDKEEVTDEILDKIAKRIDPACFGYTALHIRNNLWSIKTWID
jgi:hypothetical protein